MRGVPKIKFRHGSSARHDSGFSKDQTWLRPLNVTAHLNYVDETAEIAAIYTQDQNATTSDTDSNVGNDEDVPSSWNNNDSNDASSSSLRRPGAMGPPDSFVPRSASTDTIRSSLKRRKTNDSHSFTIDSQEQAVGNSVGALSPALSWLNLSSPTVNNLRPSTAPHSLENNVSVELNQTPFPFSEITFIHDTSPRHDPFPLNSASVHLENVPSTPIYSPSPYSPNLHQRPVQVEDSSNDGWKWESPTLRESILMRFFTDHLAHWFDLCDQERHFQLVVPQRARNCRPLLNAIFTTSARHLTRLSKFKGITTIGGMQREVVMFSGNALPDLKVETAIQYHNESIKDLIRLSMDPEQVHNENLLAAAIILRFYEEVDLPLRAGVAMQDLPEENEEPIDNELFLKVTNTFLNAQQPALAQIPHTSPVATTSNLHCRTESMDGTSFPVFYTSPSSMATPPSSLPQQQHRSSSLSASDLSNKTSRTDGLRQACFWVAFRQEITVAFLKQRPFGISLSRCSAFRSFSAAEDAIWADRLIIFCADVLEFCYGATEHDVTTDVSPRNDNITHSRRGRKEERDKWDELQSTLQKLSTVLPKSSEPIYFRPPDPTHNEIFPEIWYLDAVHVTGIQHVELARILLAASNPYMPKLGPGYVAAMTRLSAELKAIVLRLCGMALSNRRTPPGLVTACMGIAMCGEHFSERPEQEALMEVLKELETEHSWPTARTAGVLREAWGWES